MGKEGGGWGKRGVGGEREGGGVVYYTVQIIGILGSLPNLLSM
jgi:hypothetical protein